MPGFERSRSLALYFVNPLPKQRRYYPPRRPRFFNPNLLKELIVTASPLPWRRNGNDWVLFDGRRRFGRVVPDQKYPGMWRSVKSRGQLSDMANLSWGLATYPPARGLAVFLSHECADLRRHAHQVSLESLAPHKARQACEWS